MALLNGVKLGCNLIISNRTNSYKLILFLSTIVSCLLFLKGVTGEFVIDDRTYFLDNDLLPNLTPFDLLSIFSTPSNYWGEHLPVRDLFYVIQYTVFGASPIGYHLVSLCLYIVLIYLILVVTNQLIHPPFATKTNKSDPILVLSVLALFSSFPTHTESVSYISGQKDLLCAIFSMASIIVILRINDVKPSNTYMLPLFCFCYYASFLSKNLATGNIFLIPLLLLCRSGLQYIFTIKKVCFWFILNIPIVAWLLYSINLSNKYFGFNNELSHIPLAQRLVTSIEILGAHAKIALSPFHLSFGYPFEPGNTINLCIGVAIFLFAFILTIKAPASPGVIGLTFFFCFMLPVLQLFSSFSNASVYDRYLLLPSFGLCLCLCSLLQKKLSQFLFFIVILILVIILSSLKYNYIATYNSDVSATTNTYKLFPDWNTASFNLAVSFTENGQLDAVENLIATEKTLTSPSWVIPYLRGEVELRRGNLENATFWLKNAATLCQRGGYFPFPGNSLSKTLIMRGDTEQAKFWLQQVVNSKIYNPLEYYRAKRELEKLNLLPT